MTVLLVGALFTIIGIVIIIYAAFGFITGTIGAALGGGGVLGIFSTMMGAVILFVIGGVLAGVGGWLMRLWWIFLLVGAVTGSVGNTARDREAVRTSEIRVRCQNCGRLNPEFVKFCMSCNKPI
ncbi:MAG: zinc ribbon domain-containing protein [Methanobacteriota archaeon]|nr:MAG: zinc ribbon domain-containing protein [Euryarchaeota archaeon]